MTRRGGGRREKCFAMATAPGGELGQCRHFLRARDVVRHWCRGEGRGLRTTPRGLSSSPSHAKRSYWVCLPCGNGGRSGTACACRWRKKKGSTMKVEPKVETSVKRASREEEPSPAGWVRVEGGGTTGPGVESKATWEEESCVASTRRNIGSSPEFSKHSAGMAAMHLLQMRGGRVQFGRSKIALSI